MHGMHGTDAFIWFIVTVVLFSALMVLGTWLAMHSYDRGRGPVHFHLWHRRG